MHRLDTLTRQFQRSIATMGQQVYGGQATLLCQNPTDLAQGIRIGIQHKNLPLFLSGTQQIGQHRVQIRQARIQNHQFPSLDFLGLCLPINSDLFTLGALQHHQLRQGFRDEFQRRQSGIGREQYSLLQGLQMKLRRRSLSGWIESARHCRGYCSAGSV